LLQTAQWKCRHDIEPMARGADSGDLIQEQVQDTHQLSPPKCLKAQATGIGLVGVRGGWLVQATGIGLVGFRGWLVLLDWLVSVSVFQGVRRARWVGVLGFVRATGVEDLGTN
jgi:hypothetical protein